ncbi:3,4-dihydroxy-2-butanone-4-phosphate synthase [Fusibacter sp. JL298sf-3]
MFIEVVEAMDLLKKGEMIVVVDDENRENEGDLLMLAEAATPEHINFMARWGKGLICMPMTSERLEALDIEDMVTVNTDSKQTAFTVSVDARTTHTGISAYERAETVQKLMDDEATGADFTKPGHIFPLRARSGGVLERAGHTEAAVDLARLCGAAPAGVICEIMRDDGHMARLDDLKIFCEKHGLKCLKIESLIAYCQNAVEVAVSTPLPSRYGALTVKGFQNHLGDLEDFAVVKMSESEKPPLVRIHSACMTGDVLGSLKCDCGDQLRMALSAIADSPSGILLYMQQEGRGIGLVNKFRAYALQEQGMDTVEANLALGFADDLRRYDTAAQMLKALDVTRVRLMTNNPDKVRQLEACGIEVVERVPVVTQENAHSAYYMKTKKDKMAHWL